MPQSKQLMIEQAISYAKKVTIQGDTAAPQCYLTAPPIAKIRSDRSVKRFTTQSPHADADY